MLRIVRSISSRQVPVLFHLLIVDAVLYIARMYALNNDEHTYEGCSRIQLTGFYILAFR